MKRWARSLGAALDHLDESLEAGHLDLVGSWSGISAASVPRRGE